MIEGYEKCHSRRNLDFYFFSLISSNAEAGSIRKRFYVSINLKKYVSGKKEIRYTMHDGDLKRICRENGYFGGYELEDASSIICLGDSEEVAAHQIAQAQKKKKRYLELFTQIEKPGFDGSKWILKTRSGQFDEIYKTLEIDRSLSHMESTVGKYRVIQNRKPKNDS